MYQPAHLGKAFHNLRKNRNISLKQIADEHISSSMISRFERGQADISISKFLHALENMHVEVNEFMDEVNHHQNTEIIEFMSQLIPLEYQRDIEGFRRLYDEQKEKHAKNPSVHQYRLNMILVQSFISKCDQSVPFPKEYMDEAVDYLFCTEEWKIYELILIGNLYLFMNTNLLHRMGKEIINIYYRQGVNKGLIRITLLNILETCIHRNDLEVAIFYQKAILPMLENETKLYERNIYHFLIGLLHYKSGSKEIGIEEMEQSIQIYKWLSCEHLAANYQSDLEKHTD